MDASSVKMSPNMFEVTITSSEAGARSMCMAAESTWCEQMRQGRREREREREEGGDERKEEEMGQVTIPTKKGGGEGEIKRG